MHFFVLFVLQIEVAPCDKKGREYNEADDKFVDSPEELIGKDVSFARVWKQC
jgi:kinesin family protein 1